ncbi:MAG: hypothetical protein QOK40_2544 [Miltoncostaeaceae bacterium]|nr:hypothetical protein [Miltoncostaeaceae bacterium]
MLSKGGENVIEMVLRVGTPAQARDLLGWVHADELLPCRVSCEVAIRPMPVPAIPGAVGSSRIDTRGGGTAPPFDRYLVDFTIGRRLVLVERAGGPGVPTAREALTAATAAYRRILAD